MTQSGHAVESALPHFGGFPRPVRSSYCIAKQKMVQCNSWNWRDAPMASAKFFRRQAERCADLAHRTNDEESRHRYERLQHTYCYLADAEEQETVEASGDSSRRPAA
jgi:hypothetical protein